MEIAAGLLDKLKVEAYGDLMPLKSLGAVSVRDSHTLAVSVFDSSVSLLKLLHTSSVLP